MGKGVGTDESVFGQVPVPGKGCPSATIRVSASSRAPCLNICMLGHQQGWHSRLVRGLGA